MPEREPQSKQDIDAEPRHEVWDFAALKRFLAASCEANKPGVCEYEKLPRQIDLGKLAEKADALREKTDADPEHNEYAARIVWHPERKAIMTSRVSRLEKGTKRNVYVENKIQPIRDFSSIIQEVYEHHDLDNSINPWDLPEEQQNEIKNFIARNKILKPIGVIHSHPTDGPLSPNDVMQVLIVPNSKMMMMTATDNLQAIIPTRRLKRIDRSQANTLEVEWINLLQKSLIARFNREPELKHRFDSDPDLQKSMVHSQFEALFAHLGEKYGFGYYKGDHSGIVRRLVPKKS